MMHDEYDVCKNRLLMSQKAGIETEPGLANGPG